MGSTDDEPKGTSPSLFDSMIGSAGKQAPLSRILRRGDGQKRLGSQDMSPQSQIANMEVGEADSGNSTAYRTYKRRWFGLLQLVLMNIIVSWDVSVH
jgi:MFS transporter, FLVCR family, MFS-domain-containing protein 7